MGDFVRGDRVKLTDNAARTFMRGVAMPRKRNTKVVDWFQRRGAVISATAKYVIVHWDGRKTYDQWPLRAIEKADVLVPGEAL
jgi:hypothetical protein